VVGGGGDFTSTNPIWVPATVAFNGRTWTNVGVRFKGNSTLSNGWRNGTDKLPLKLDFDEFEEDYPEIDGQRFYGLRIFLSNNQNEDVHAETVAYSLLEEAGLPASKTARQIADHGEARRCRIHCC
jgi:spore coat protein CotH